MRLAITGLAICVATMAACDTQSLRSSKTASKLTKVDLELIRCAGFDAAFLSIGTIVVGAEESIPFENITPPTSTYREIRKDALGNFNSLQYVEAERLLDATIVWWIRRYIEDASANPARFASFIKHHKPECSEF